MGSAPVAGVATCPRCGEVQAVGGRYCTRCGFDVGQNAPPATPASSAGPPPARLSASGIAPPLAAAPLIDRVESPSEAPVPGARGVVPPSAVGRRASLIGWVAAALGATLFLAGGIGILLVDLRLNPPSPTIRQPDARWDQMIRSTTSVRAGESLEISEEVISTGTVTSDWVWIVVEWRPDSGTGPAGDGMFVSCVPSSCRYREDPTTGRTLVSWPGLAPGERRLLRLEVAAPGATEGQSFDYIVHAGIGPDAERMRGGYDWTLEAEVTRGDD